MPTELEELVEFLHHGNTQIRQVAAEHLVGYSQAQPSIFKTGQLTPVKDLKLLVKDYAPIAKHALTILINISNDKEVLSNLVKDDEFLETLLLRITSSNEPNANEMAMLLANLAKDDGIAKLIKLKRDVPKGLSTSDNAMDQLMDCFVKGAAGAYNKHADFDYLSYFFADIAKHAEGRTYFTTPQAHDSDIIPLTKLIVFTEHKSHIRRLGVASTIKNVAFHVPAHGSLLSLPSVPDSQHVNLLPYILLPLMGPEDYSEEDMDGMPEDLQLLPPDKERESDYEIMKTHLESIMLLTATKEGREELRRAKVYPVMRECHLHVDDEGVREACDRVVQVIMREEAPEDKLVELKDGEDEDEDEQIIDVL